MKEPLVSVCVPTYNGATYLKEALDSINNQTYKNIEVVISDDASTDTTLSIASEFKKNAGFPVLIIDHNPSGIGANWNNCIEKSNGKYIKFLFQDDVLETTCVAKMVEVMENVDSVKLVVSKRSVIISESFKSDKIGYWKEHYGDLQKSLRLKMDNGLCILDKKIFKSDEFFKRPLNKFGEPSAMLFRKDLIKKTGGFKEDLIQILDFEFCNRVLLKFKIAVLDEKLVRFRLHSEQASSKNEGDDSDVLKYNAIIYNEYFWHLNSKTKMKLLKKHNMIIKTLVNLKRKRFF